MTYDKLQILIPAYKPDDKLNKLIDDLKAAGLSNIVVVDDGGGAPFREIFVKAASQGATVLTHEVNRGKGAALKTGLNYIYLNTPDSYVVTADADGQHRPEDIKKLADAIPQNPEALLLGSRDKKLMPPRSKAGNTLTCFVFFCTNGQWVKDTQTGLRVLPPNTLERFAHIEGDRYEYEMNMLITARHEKIKIVEITIETIYIDDNASSHFNALKDGMRIYKLLLRQFVAFAGASIISFAVDYLAAWLLRLAFVGQIALPTYGARLISSLVNFFLNKKLVFKSGKDKWAIVKYFALAACVIMIDSLFIKLFTHLFGNSNLLYMLGKAIADVVMFFVNYFVQKKFIFVKK